MKGKRKKSKIKSYLLPYGFRNFSVNYEKWGWTYQVGGANRNFQIFKSRLFQNILEGGWTYQLMGAFRNHPQEASGRQAPPFSPINRGGRLFQKCSWPLGYAFQLFWVKKRVSMKKIQAEVLPYCFWDVSVSKSMKIIRHSSPFFVWSSFILWSSTGKCLNPRLSIFFSSIFNEL